LRPLRLELQAFGPYVERQVVDFARLADRRIFLIAGPTGSGKTTLLDAICFALYGETSGGEREAKQMRCQLANTGTPTEVTLEFALGDVRYRVIRVPDQERPKRRGTGITRQRATATLCRLEGGREVTLASQWGQATEQVERLLGFRSDQFRQTVLLPQGQFRRLLLADSRQRQQVLEALFQTEIYRRIEDGLREAARDVRQRVGELQQERRLILAQVEVESAEELAQRRTTDGAELLTRESQLEAAQAEASGAARQLAEAREASRRMEELRAAETALTALERQRDEMAERERRARRARRAAGLVDLERRLRELTEEEERAATALEAARHDLERAHRARQQSRKTLEREVAREDTRERLRQELDRLEQIARRSVELDGARAELAKQRGEVERIVDLRRQRREQLERRRETTAATREKLGQARQLAAEVERWRAELVRTQGALALAARLAETRERSEQARAVFHRVQRELDHLEVAVRRAHERLEALEQTWRAGQAALLARGLATGKPCPVCGSWNHPAPCSREEPVPTDSELERERQALIELQHQRDQLREEAARHRLEDHRLATELITLAESLGEINAEETAMEVQRAREALARAEEAEARRNELERELATRQTLSLEIESALAEDEELLLSARVRLGELERGLELLAEELPSELKGEGSLDDTLAAARSQLERLTRRLERAREADRLAGEAQAGRREVLRLANERARLAGERQREAERGFAERLEAAGFESVLAYRDSRMDEPELERLEARVNHHRQDLAAAHERQRRAVAACPVQLELTSPDVQTLERAADAAQRRFREASDACGQLRARLAQLELLSDRLGEVERASSALERRYGAVGGIAEVAAGANPHRISFQRFVLASLLDLVLEAASRRLRTMSRGRYDLQRVRSGEGDLRRAGGLDLTVFDGYTGSERPVHTLSGGESFLAALSLALGLADVVQAQAGGIRLETIFVDEGFGSLDPESFELAYRTLVDLEGGERLVAIISHVPELKEMIDVRLEVIPGRGGSSLQLRSGGPVEPTERRAG
jgi:exonuclease SbcC